MRRVVIIVALSVIAFSGVNAYGAEWKFLGVVGASKITPPPNSSSWTGQPVVYFYDAESVKYGANGNAKVWIKLMPDTQLDKICREEGFIRQRARAQEIYICPSDTSLDIQYFQNLTSYASFTACWEAAANYNTQGTNIIELQEINCGDGMHRQLSVYMYDDEGNVKSDDTEEQWSYIAPETIMDELQKLLCK